MIIKDKFTLLKDVPNILNLSESIISAYEIENGPRKAFVMLKLIEGRVNHFTKERVLNFVESIKKREKLRITNIPNYPLSVSYNKKTESIIINLHALGSEDISRIDAMTIYASIVYGLMFSGLVNEKAKINPMYTSNIVSFLLGIFTRLFGKEYGLLGIYSTEIPKLKFLISCYILRSFFGFDNDASMYKKASSISSFDYKAIEEELGNYDFSSIENFIDSLSKLKVMPGINKYFFTSKFLNLLGYSFIPALEDCSRFLSTIITSSLKSSNVVSTFLFKYNETEYSNLLTLTKSIFQKV